MANRTKHQKRSKRSHRSNIPTNMFYNNALIKFNAKYLREKANIILDEDTDSIEE